MFWPAGTQPELHVVLSHVSPFFLPDLLSVAPNTVLLNYYVCVALYICKAFYNHSLANHILSLLFKIYWALCAWHYVAYIITINNAIYCQALGTIQH